MIPAARRLTASYRARLLLGYAITVSLVAAAWGWSLYGPLTRSVVDMQQQHLQSVAQAAALALAESEADPTRSVRQLVARTELRVTVVAADGRVLADSEEDPAGMASHADRPEIRAALDGRVGRDSRLSATQGVGQMYVAVPASLDGRRAALRVSESLARIDALAADARRTGLLLLAATIIASLMITNRVAERAAAPVVRLAGAAHAMSRGDLSAHVPAEPGELGVLSSALADLGVQMRARLAALDDERSNLRRVLDGLPDGVFMLENDSISLANNAMSALFRRPPGGFVGRSLDKAGLPASLVATVRQLAADGGSAEMSDAAQRCLRIAVTPLTGLEGPDRALVTISDVTERARLDTVRRDFVANASHELKTPTAGIQLLAESARMAAEDGDAEQALAFVSQVEGEATRMRRLVQDLLDLSRLEGQPAEGALADLRPAVDLAIAAHGRAAAGKGLLLTVDDSAVADIDIHVAADPTDLAVLLDNLLDNAIKYTRTGGVTIRLAVESAEVVLGVEDTGIGIPAEELPRIFERFYRVDRARTRESGGTGLGLSLVKHVVERSGGSISVESVVDAGTKMEVRLPRAG